MPGNNNAFARNYTSAIDEVYQRASVSGVLSSGRRMVCVDHKHGFSCQLSLFAQPTR